VIELHAHSTASDGLLSPTDLVRHAAAAGVSTLALTDHDTVAGIDEARRAAEAHGIDFLPAIELTVGVPHGSMHLLAYLPDEVPEEFTAGLDILGDRRRDRAMEIVDRLAALGVPVPWEAVERRAQHRIGRPHIAAALVECGHAADEQEAFDRWLADGRPAHIPQRGLDARRVVRSVRDQGGVPVLAHPATLRLPPRHLSSFVQSLTAHGLVGIEVHRPEHLPEQRDAYRTIAKRLRLIPCGGSDFHRPDGPFAIADTGTPGLPADTPDRLRAALG